MVVDAYYNPAPKAAGQGAAVDTFNIHNTIEAQAFHKTFKEYAQTPLHDLPGLAKNLGLGRVFVKDESLRFGLNAFKVLGATYAIGKYLAGIIGKPLEKLGSSGLASRQAREKTGQITFATTTDGNHGRGVAWAAKQLGHKAVVYMPKGSAQSRVDNIIKMGAQCEVTNLNYDDAVRMTWDKSQKNGWIMVQDTAWDGYEDIPAWIMYGYTTLAVEALDQMRAIGVGTPTHVFLQAGVGSFAGAVLGCMVANLGPKMPIFAIAEPHKANCIYKSAKADDGKPHSVTGNLETLMAGLSCGEPNTISWSLLRDYASAYFSCPDYMAANGMRILAAPLCGDTPVISGESGAITTGLAQWIMQTREGEEAREHLGLNENSRLLLISTEGDTSPSTYRDIVWFGRYSRWDSPQ